MDPIVLPTPADVAALSGPDLDRMVVALETVRRQLEATYLAVIDRADETRRFTTDGHASVRGWVQALTDSSPTETARRLQTMRALRELPGTAAALADGRIGVDHDARVFERNGTVVIHATCATMQGAEMLEIFSRQCDAEWLADWEAARVEHGNDATPAHLARTDAQRRMDALHLLFRRSVAVPADAKTAEPVVDYVISNDVYDAELIAIATGTRRPAATLDDIDRQRCETSTGMPLDPRDVVLASLHGHIRRIVTDDTGRVIDYGRKRRFTGASRDAVIIGDGRRCTWPGCGRDTNRNQIDHTLDHAHGGNTRSDNGGPLCPRHNRWKNRGYTITRDPDSTWHTHRPDGTELTQPGAA